MLYFVLVLNLVIYWVSFGESSGADSLEDGSLVTKLRNDANIDLSADEEYEDLRAEFLAYHTALASLASTSRRSMKTTPCWSLGGVCINHKLCEPHKFLTEIPGCKDHLEVCCFTWNKFYVRDQSEHGLKYIAMPWNYPQEVGGKGVIGPLEEMDTESEEITDKPKREPIIYSL